MRLLKYKYKGLVPFGDGEYKTVYELTLVKSYLFGLIKRQFQITYEISMFGSISKYEKYWDEVIDAGGRVC